MEDDKAPSKILDFLYLGSRIHAKDKDMLDQLHIHHILNATPARTVDPVAGVPNFFEKDKAFTYRRCALFDNKGEDILRSLEGCIAFIEQSKHYGRQPVYVDSHRLFDEDKENDIPASASSCSAMSPDYNNSSFLCQACPNDGFWTQLQEYEVRLQRQEMRSLTGTMKGPQRPPQGGATRVIGPSIGPSMPPGFASRDAEEAADGGRSRNIPGCTNADNIDNCVPSNGGLDTESKATSGPSIGPALPPHLRKTHTSETEEASPHRMLSVTDQAMSTEKTSERSDINATSKPVSIGPALPPHLSKGKRKATEDVESSASSEFSKRNK